MRVEYITMISTLEENKVLDKLEAADKYAIDTETTGLDPHNDKLCLFQIATENTCYLLNIAKLGEAAMAQVMAVINKKEKLWILHNAKFDLKFLYAYGYKIKAEIYDSLLAESVLLQKIGKGRLSLRYVIYRHLGIKLDKSMQISDWSKMLSQKQKIYAANDVRYLFQLRRAQLIKAEKRELNKCIDIENKAVKATAWLEFSGSLVDICQLQKELAILKMQEKSIVKRFQKLYGEHVNINSPQQILPIVQKRNPHILSTKREDLTDFCNDVVVQMIVEYKDIHKEIESLQGIKKYLNNSHGWLYANYGQNFTSTGRYTSSKPNLQGIPKSEKFRKLFIAPMGKKLVICDYSQMELRLMAEIANDQEMIKAYKQNLDLHTLTAATINRCTYEEVDSKMRCAAKAMNFGLIYGMSTRTFISYAKKNYGVLFSISEAMEVVGMFKEKYEAVTQRLYDLEYKEDNFEKSLSGRTRVWKDRMPSLNQRANYAIQATGADIIKEALYQVEVQLIELGVIEFYGCIHDEIILVADENIAEEVAVKLKNIMEKAGKKYLQKVTLIADVVVGKNRAVK